MEGMLHFEASACLSGHPSNLHGTCISSKPAACSSPPWNLILLQPCPPYMHVLRNKKAMRMARPGHIPSHLKRGLLAFYWHFLTKPQCRNSPFWPPGYRSAHGRKPRMVVTCPFVRRWAGGQGSCQLLLPLLLPCLNRLKYAQRWDGNVACLKRLN